MNDPQEVIKGAFERPHWYVSRNAFNIKIRIETIREFTRHLKPNNILDIGCGDGSLSLPLLTESNHITFLDRSKSMLDLVMSRIPRSCADRIDLLNMDFMDCRLQEEAFDLIICVGVMAYIEDGRSFIRKIATLLKPGGTLIIECSDGSHLYTRINRLYEKFRVKLGGADFPTIARPASELKTILEESGFEGCEVFRYSLPPYVLLRLLTNEASYGLIRLIFGTARQNLARSCGNEYLIKLRRKTAAATPWNTSTRETIATANPANQDLGSRIL